MCNGCATEGFKSVLQQPRWTCRQQWILERSTSLIHRGFWELRRCQALSEAPGDIHVHKTKSQLSGGTSILDVPVRDAWWGLLQIEWHRRGFAELTSEQILEWDGEQAKRHLETKSRSNTVSEDKYLCPRKQRGSTHQKFKVVLVCLPFFCVTVL